MSKIIYLVEGRTGEYDDKQSWEVKAFVSKEKAIEFTDKVQFIANDIAKLHWMERLNKVNELDPYMRIIDNEIFYTYCELELDESL